MIEKPLTVTNPKGIHARPSALLAQTALAFRSSITLFHNGVVANAKSILDILSLAAPFMSVITVRVEGEDEKEAFAAIAEVFEKRFADIDR